MAYTTINKSTDNFNTVAYTGTGSTRNITALDFQPDWVWIKGRSFADAHYIYDAVRGVGNGIYSHSNAAQSFSSTTLTAFNSDGFTVGSEGGVNGNGQTLVSWNWKAGTGQGSSNTDGSINTTYTSVNTTAGFSISTYTGNATAGATIGHGLGVVPKMIITKKLNGTPNWAVYHAGMGSPSKYLELNTTAAETTDNAVWDGANPTASVFYVGSDNKTNGSGGNYVAYCFAEKTGYSKFGSYTGNGNANGAFIYTGFVPSFVMIKRTNSTTDWMMFDNKRTDGNPNLVNKYLLANDSGTEGSNSTTGVDFLSNGFKTRNTFASVNASGGTYVYMAFGQSLVGSNNVPCTAR